MNSEAQPNPLSDDEARQLAEHLSVVTQSGRPLAPAFAPRRKNCRIAGWPTRWSGSHAIWNRDNRSKPFWKRIRGSCRSTWGD